MDIQKVNLGAPVTGEGGDLYREAHEKINSNFDLVKWFLQSFRTVEEFGAVGDGITNDTAAFEAADASGEVIYVGAGSYWLDHLVPETDYYNSKFFSLGEVAWTNDNRRVFFRFNIFGNMNSRISNSQTVGREELQIYADGDPWDEGSTGSGIHLYGNRDSKHSGAIAMMTGQDESGDARMIITGGASDPTQRAYRGIDNNTHVTIGNGIWRFTDDGRDMGLLNLRTPINGPAIRISNVSDDDTHVADIGVSDGRDFTIKQYTETTVQEPTVSQYVFQLNRDGGARFYDARNSSDNSKYALFRPDFSNGSTPKLEIRCDKTLSNGAGINLYGGTAGDILFFTGGKTTVRVNGDSGIRLYPQNHESESATIEMYSSIKPSLDTVGALEVRANKTLNDGSGIDMYGTITGNIIFYTGGAASLRLEASGKKALTAGTDAIQNLGTASMRWSDLFILNAPIVSSDRRIKTEIKPINAAVLKAWESVEWVQYRLKDSIEQKANQARIHTGLIAQDIETAFAEQGLDAYAYGVLCKDTWNDELDTDGNVIIKAGELLSVRYDQAQAIEAAYIRSKLK